MSDQTSTKQNRTLRNQTNRCSKARAEARRPSNKGRIQQQRQQRQRHLQPIMNRARIKIHSLVCLSLSEIFQTEYVRQRQN